MGSCLIIRREVLDQAGLLDERFFLYFEEVDLCLRAKAAGWKIVFFPDRQMQVVHAGGASSEQDLALRYLHRHRSLCLWYRKHYAAPWVLVIKGIVLAGLILRMSACGILAGVASRNGTRSRYRDLFKAYRGALRSWRAW